MDGQQLCILRSSPHTYQTHYISFVAKYILGVVEKLRFLWRKYPKIPKDVAKSYTKQRTFIQNKIIEQRTELQTKIY